jgi:pyruvate dehydrogenase E2 component (dihydrolipoamide acetyltransferase)
MTNGSYAVQPLSPLRKIIAARMTEATRTIPHFRLVTDIEMDALLAAREKLNAAQPQAKVTVNDCLVKGCATALMAHPAVNCQLVGEEIHHYHQADISVIIAVEGGLSTPVIRAANRKSVRDIAAEVKALAARAAHGQLKMSEILGGSFSISNLGGLGVDQFDAIINPPQCAILAVGRAKPRVVVAARGETRVATVLRATLSVDHRAIDGAVAAAFMQTLRNTVGVPSSWLEIEDSKSCRS